MTTITFLNSCPFTGNRPYADVKLNPLIPNSPTHKCLVDTGADYLQLPASAASKSCISLSNSVRTTVNTVAGVTSLQLVHGVVAEIEGTRATIDVLFDTTNSFPPIAGRQLLLKAFNLGFNNTHWLWT
jgi:predicted aspartyl protease